MINLEAIVVPTRIEEVAIIKRNIALWSAADFSPSNRPSAAKPALNFVFNNSDAQQFETEIRDCYTQGALSRYFRELNFTYLGLTGLNDMYSRSAKGPVGPGGYKAGPNNQFFGSMELYRDCPGAIFYMETDCVPVRSGWLDAASDVVRQHQHAFVIGSAYRGKGKLRPRIFRHVNGNAIYCVGRPGFSEFLSNWKTWLAELISSGSNNLAYDILVETVFSMAAENERAHDFFQNYFTKIQYTDFIQNISSPDDKYLIEPLVVRSIIAECPDTFLAHGALFSQAADKLMADGVELRPENLVLETFEKRRTNHNKLLKLKMSIIRQMRRSADWLDNNELKYALFRSNRDPRG